MAKVDITIPGERIVESFTALVPQPTAPSTARAPDVGLVELSYVNPTVLVPGPPGPPGPAGSHWYTGVGDPTTPGTNFGDMYLNDTDGTIWTWNGTAWVDTGTDLSPDASELLLKIKTVDGSGSGLDADTLDGLDSLYFAPINSPTFTGDPKAPTPAAADNDTSIATTAFVKTNIAAIPPTNWASIPGKPATFPPTLPIAESDVTNLVTDLSLKAPIASPTFTGDPKAPTPATSDNDTSIATTAYVKANLAALPPSGIAEAPVDGKTYGRLNAAWAAVVGGAIVSDAAPAGPQPGQMWFKSNSGDTYIWVDDGNSTQWVQQNLMPPATIPSNYITATAQTRNRIVNGAMQISQEWGSAAGTAQGYHAADQWPMTYVTSGTVTAVQVQAVTPNGSQNRLRLSVTVADASLAATDLAQFYQMIEGIRIADFVWGSAAARQVILRFGWKSPAGTYTIALQNAADTRSYIASFTISAGQANTDTTQTFVIPGDTTGAWPTGAVRSLILVVAIACGSSRQGVAGWQAGNLTTLAGTTNGLATAGNVFELFDVGLYLDPLATGVAPRWEMPDEAQELASCQRYWERGQARWDGTCTNGVSVSAPVWYKSQKRTAPAISAANISQVAFPAASLGAQNPSGDGHFAFRTANASGAGLFIEIWTANARM